MKNSVRMKDGLTGPLRKKGEEGACPPPVRGFVGGDHSPSYPEGPPTHQYHSQIQQLAVIRNLFVTPQPVNRHKRPASQDFLPTTEMGLIVCGGGGGVEGRQGKF